MVYIHSLLTNDSCCWMMLITCLCEQTVTQHRDCCSLSSTSVCVVVY